jgi:hypothetical protein
MKIYLDDTRHPTQSFLYTNDEIYLKDWVIVKDFESFKFLIDSIILNQGNLDEVEVISYDHDLADEHYHQAMLLSDHTEYNNLYEVFQEKTGLDCVKYLIEVCLDNLCDMPQFLVHTQNPVGHLNITAMLKNFEKYQKNEK